MANPFTPFGAASALLQNPTASPLQNPVDPAAVAALEQANAGERLKKSALQQALFRAAALREQPNYAAGAGPGGIRIGQGPGGWAVSIGDLIAGLMARGKQDKSTEGVTAGMGDAAGAQNNTFGAYNALRRKEGGQQSYVPQGTPLSFGDL